jgi:V/A-type H+-transporting ATPase subunit E
MILSKGDEESERILSQAKAEAVRWAEEQTGHLNAMIAAIRADATKRSGEITTRQLNEAESSRDKSRLRLQNELVSKALILLQEALIGFSNRPDYDAILTGVASEACERLPGGQKVKIRLRAEDASHGEPVVKALSLRFPELDVSFDSEPAPITGGVFLYSDEEKWRVVADWKSKVEEMADSVAKAVLAEL